MAGWSKAKRTAFEKAFYTFLDNCWINSKDAGFICLGKNLYDGQRRLLTEIFDGLEADIHKFYILKSRQLGITTITRALNIFYIGVHKGMKGALVFDTAPNREEARAELVTMIRDLPTKLKFPKIKGSGEGNREGVTLENDSKILFKNAGVKKSKSSGTLGRSVGLTVAHLSEICSYDNDEGLESFEQSLSDSHPDRLYVYESTARGYNRWWEIWHEARKDPAHCKCIFLGWWSKDSQHIPRDSADFALYGETPPTDKEQVKIALVRERYGVQITPEQLAWIRRKYDPTAQREGDADPEYEGSVTRIQEQPWVEEDAFQQTGSVFFAPEKLGEITAQFVSNKFQTFMYACGAEFVDMRVFKAVNSKSIDLKIWEEPDPDGVYVLGCDPAFGENEMNDRSSIQVCRCYADGIDQVAEYASPLVATHQLAWVIASLLGYYGQQTAQIRYALELNGPGTAVFNELRSLKHQLENGYQPREVEEKGLKDVFRNVRTYIYSRADSMGVGTNYHIKCLAIDTDLPTPTGWKKLADIEIGDTLFDEKGQPCSVLRVSDVKYGQRCYRVTFDDGSSLVADEEHVWEVRGCREAYDKHARHVKTVDLSPKRDVIVIAEPLVLPSKNLPIDPYMLGVWLGDGYSASGRFCSHEDDIEEISGYLEESGLTLSPIYHGRTMDYRNVPGLITTLRETKLWNNKHIPSEYLRASAPQRVALLQGLMDTDGTLNPANGRQCLFATTNPILAEGFAELVRGLGIKAKKQIRHPTLIYKGKTVQCATAYYFNFTCYDDLQPFRLKRKVTKTKVVGATRHRVSRRHRIVSVEPIESVPVKCIQVDSPSHLYLAGRSMVPTHNTTGPLKVTFLERMRDFVSNGMFRIRSMDLIDEMKTISREGDSIKAPGSMKDDRVLAAAFAIHCWETGPRKQLMGQKRTRDAEAARKRLSIVDQVYLFQQNQLSQFFDQKRRVRVSAQRQATRQSWRYR